MKGRTRSGASSPHAGPRQARSARVRSRNSERRAKPAAADYFFFFAAGFFAAAFFTGAFFAAAFFGAAFFAFTALAIVAPSL